MRHEGMILACPSRFPNAPDPLVKSFPDGSALIILADGSGSWGHGVEAADWFTKGMAAALVHASAARTSTVFEILAALVGKLPHEMAQGDFGWGFSLCSILTGRSSVEIAISGSLACAIRSDEILKPVHVARRLADQFVEQGQVTLEEAERGPLANIILEPLFEGAITSLSQYMVAELKGGDTIFVGHACLPAVLQRAQGCKAFHSATELRDIVEKAGGRSAPTAIVVIG